MNTFILLKALEIKWKDERLQDAFTAIISAYFDEYEDATELDTKTYLALETLWNVCFPYDTEDGEDFYEFLERVTKNAKK